MDGQINPNDISQLNAASSSSDQSTGSQVTPNPGSTPPTAPVNSLVTPVSSNATPAMPINTDGVSSVSTSVDPLLTDKTFREDLDERWNSWKCLNCGYVYEGVEARNTCPRCGNADPDKFEDRD